jgi:hypothetical protein
MESHAIVYRVWNNQSNAIANHHCFVYLYRNRDVESVRNVYVHFNRNLYRDEHAHADRYAYKYLRIHADSLEDGNPERSSNDDTALHGNGVADA